MSRLRLVSAELWAQSFLFANALCYLGREHGVFISITLIQINLH